MLAGMIPGLVCFSATAVTYARRGPERCNPWKSGIFRNLEVQLIGSGRCRGAFPDARLRVPRKQERAGDRMQDVALRRGDLVPHFDTTTVDGRPFRYADVWQRSNLVLLILPKNAAAEARGYVAELRTRVASLTPANSVVAAVEGPVAGLPGSAIVLSDRWGEITQIMDLPASVAGWPEVADVVEWLEFIRMKCPECPA
jgi:hypothetical protein